MNAVETLEIIKALHSVGATHFKSSDFEINLSGSSPLPALDIQKKTEVNEPVVENKEATEKLKELIGTMSLSPEALADKIFPAGAGN